MKKTRALSLTALFSAVLLLAACATTPTRPLKSEFQDIPVPKGMNYVPDRSAIIDMPNVKAARFVYRGRYEMESLAVSMRAGLEGSGWRHRGSTTTSTAVTNQIYEKAGNFVQVVFWEGTWYTYMEVTASQTLQAAR
jgi:hypothetical protein